MLKIYSVLLLSISIVQACWPPVSSMRSELSMEKNQMEHQNQINAIFTQLVDHFDVLNNNTWSQEYFVDDTYWKGPGGESMIIGLKWNLLSLRLDKDYKSGQILKLIFKYLIFLRINKTKKIWYLAIYVEFWILGCWITVRVREYEVNPDSVSIGTQMYRFCWAKKIKLNTITMQHKVPMIYCDNFLNI